jgi:hypothetical protein
VDPTLPRPPPPPPPHTPFVGEHFHNFEFYGAGFLLQKASLTLKNKFPAFMESKGSLSCQQNPDNGSYPEPANPVHNITYNFQNQSNTVLSALIVYITREFFLGRVFHAMFMQLSLLPCVLPTLPISTDLI